MVISYNPGMQIVNADALPAGRGARYLEVLEPHDHGLPLIAVAWRRTRPAKLAPRHHLIEFPKPSAIREMVADLHANVEQLCSSDGTVLSEKGADGKWRDVEEAR